jgi:hypothetical protein
MLSLSHRSAARELIRRKHLRPQRLQCSLSSALYAEFFQDDSHMRLDGTDGNRKRTRNFLICSTNCEFPKDVAFSWC